MNTLGLPAILIIDAHGAAELAVASTLAEPRGRAGRAAWRPCPQRGAAAKPGGHGLMVAAFKARTAAR